MKKKVLNIFAFATVVIAIVSFKNSDTKIENNSTEAKALVENEFASEYIVDITASSIEWKGSKPTGTHNGTIKLSNGTFKAEGNAISSGTFTMDMSSLKDADGNTRLEGHLKSDDFFDIEKFPNAKFVVTGINNRTGKTMLIGNLTIKDKTNAISFPITVKSNEDTVIITSETFIIDRSKWNVRYGSKSFFDNLGDKFISDEVELKINVVAKKA
ncbi:YceI family protein [Flavobacteriaceae bacterium AU392]|nr:YceI family protein [Flavobacteriaceae bacterium]RKM81202.1 YceI family protein [Flavobacteriaceae bacterium AU392]